MNNAVAIKGVKFERRFFSRVNKTDSCWLWTGYVSQFGYGNIYVNKKNSMSHRISWEYHIGKIPQDFLVLHKCDVRSCVNPKHLFIGTHKDNTQDMISKNRVVNVLATRNKLKTHCKNGHKFDETSNYYDKRLLKNRRQCRMCSRISASKSQRNKKNG